MQWQPPQQDAAASDDELLALGAHLEQQERWEAAEEQWEAAEQLAQQATQAPSDHPPVWSVRSEYRRW